MKEARQLGQPDVWGKYTACLVRMEEQDYLGAKACVSELRPDAPAELLAPLYVRLASVAFDRPGNVVEADDEAKRAIDEATALEPASAPIWTGVAALALQLHDAARLQTAADQMLRLAPKAPESHAYASLSALTKSDFDGAELELDRARALGLSAEGSKRIAEAISDNRPWYALPLKIGAVVFVWWLVGLLLLFTAGLLLSRLALRAARSLPVQRTGRAIGMSARLRVAYSVVIGLCCGYYYVSIPIVIALVVGCGVAIVGGILAAGFIAVKLFFLVGVVVLASLGAILKSLFVRRVDTEPGLRLASDQYPELRAVLDEVAARVGTASVDTVYLTPDATVAVFERGNLLGKLRHKSERCLV